MKKHTWVILLTILISAPVFSAGNQSNIDERLKRVERLVNSQGLVDIMVRVESMQSELQRLVGEIEVQKHTLGEIKKRQRDLYIDLDRRILQMERRSGSTSRSSVTREPSSNLPLDTVKNKTNHVKNVNTTVVKGPKKHVVMKKKEGEQVAYQKAFDLLRALRYEKATNAFRQFLSNYPNGRYAHIAQYWLAETSYHTRNPVTPLASSSRWRSAPSTNTGLSSGHWCSFSPLSGGCASGCSKRTASTIKPKWVFCCSMASPP